MKHALLLVLLLIGTSGRAQLQTGSNVAIAETESGKVRGYVHNGIYTYKGIPYAEAARFEAPRKPKAWTGVRSSMTYGPVAPLMEPTTSVQDESEFVYHHDWGYTSEDCLRLNVWTPGLSDGKKRPVMVWLPGGGFVSGSSQELPSYDGENLAKKGDVVLVSLNHRLNILGFLDLSAYGEKYKHSANVSMLDIVAAMQWVQQNIARFGGDPDNVTIFGQSGGGAKVNTLMAMPSAKGLFHKAINQSGSARGSFLEKPVTQAVAAALLRELRLRPEQVDSLQTIPFAVLSEAGKKAMQQVAGQPGSSLGGMPLSWGPSRDGADLPYQLLAPEALELSKNIPLLIGTTKNEFMTSLGAGLANASEEEVMGFIRNRYKDKADAYLKAVRQAYPNDKRPSDLIDIDARYRPGALRVANAKSAVAGGAPVFLYLFTWQSPVLDGKYKAIHCMDIPFAFNNIARCEEMTGGTKEAYALADKVSQAWINFARTGNPGHKGLPTWPAYTAGNTATMHLDVQPVVRPQHDRALLELMAQ